VIRGTWVFRNGEMVAKGSPEDIRYRPPRSHLPAPMLISDHLADVVNPVNGRPYDSKSAYYKAVRSAGCEIMGNDAPTSPGKPQDDGPPIHDIERSVAEAFQQHS
jgi:hypothetical protein